MTAPVPSLAPAKPEEVCPPQPMAALNRSCAACGAPMAWMPAKARLGCGHCGAEVVVPLDHLPLKEYPVAGGLVQQAMERLPTADDTREFQCGQCGAVSLGRAQEVGRDCAFCGGPLLAPKPERTGVLVPQGVWPFAIDRAQAREAFQKWISTLWFRPNDLARKAELDSLRGVYVPYFTFDALVDSDWTAERGDYYYVTVTGPDGKPRQERRIRWTRVSGRRRDRHDDLLVCASKSLPRDIADGFSTFRTATALPFHDEYLWGFVTERYAVPLDAAHGLARNRMAEEQRRRCAGDVGGDTYRNLVVHNDFSAETFKHLLLPLWILAFRYGPTIYSVGVNGCTGEVRGHAPYSWVKITLAIMAALAVAVALFSLTDEGRDFWRSLGF